ncbi:peptidoglycan DD-metalloendopeptidase family protein [uncultured Actinomyces sp.]|uniref:peptidoglycan DD-metalloendopeptidase family protein n=1 Tax=uncultured Actinomyces sp. TaxID=249061 RepID=UPI0028E6F757|nr:peptidoglycan DD-metalloendopeptidase family protein [uncultured Actinomyces sp.]
MFRSLRRPRRGVVRAGALALAFASFIAMSRTLPARADDDRDAAANAAAEAQATVNALQSQLEGIDASLAQVYIDLQNLNAQIPEAQTAYDNAVADYDKKSREHTTILGELSAAKGEQTRIDDSLKDATTQADDSQRAIADLVRRKYRDGNVDPVAVALTSGGTESITERAAAADMALRTENQTMTSALDVSSSQRTQSTRQGAITDRIADLEEKAAQAEADAQTAKDDADAKLTELNDLKDQASAKQTEWDAQKGQVQASLDQAEADYQARSDELAAIDAANQSTGVSYTSSSGFRNPLDIPIVVTSPFGMRYHPVLGIMKGHSGTDMAADCGTIIHAVASGYVSAVSSDVSAGNYVDVNHGIVGGNSVITEYLHMQVQYVSPGQYVNAGDALGEVGSTGYATGCHLHFGVLENGNYVEPMDYL